MSKQSDDFIALEQERKILIERVVELQAEIFELLESPENSTIQRLKSEISDLKSKLDTRHGVIDVKNDTIDKLNGFPKWLDDMGKNAPPILAAAAGDQGFCFVELFERYNKIKT